MRVLVYGATGLAGSLVARALAARGHDLTLAGRDRVRLDQAAAQLGDVQVQAASVHDRAALERALAGHDVVVSCAGPHGRVGEPVLVAALGAGAHYIDIALEQAFVRSMYERYESFARRAGVIAVSGLGAAGGLGDLCARLAAAAVGVHAGEDAAEDVADAIRVAYAMERMRAAPGLRRAAVDALSAPACEWAGDRWDAVSPLGERRRVRFAGDEHVALAVPAAEAITVPRHAAAGRVQGFLAVPGLVPGVAAGVMPGVMAGAAALGPTASRLATLVGPLMAAALRSPLGAYARALAGAEGHAPDADERAASHVTIVAEAERGAERGRVVVRARDPYALTAELVVLGVERLGAEPLPRAGSLAPAELLDAEGALAALGERAGLVLKFG